MNKSSGLRQSRQPSSQHSVEDVIEQATDARDIAKDLLRRRRPLPQYTDDNPDTPPTNPNINITVNTHAQGPTPSQPDIKVETETEVSIGPIRAKGVPRWAIGAGVVAAAVVTALVTKLLGG